jgi:hypothetical protein
MHAASSAETLAYRHRPREKSAVRIVERWAPARTAKL